MLSAYEIWPASSVFPRQRYIRIRGVRGLGEEASITSEAPVTPPVPVQPAVAGQLGKALFVGTAYGIALSMITSELLLRKPDAATQLRQNHKLMLLGALFGAGTSAFVAARQVSA